MTLHTASLFPIAAGGSAQPNGGTTKTGTVNTS